MAMDRGMDRWYEAAKIRFSVRKYLGDPSEGDLNVLEASAELLRAHGVRIEILCEEDVFKPAFLWYGRIKGTKCCAAIIHENSAAPEYIGYIGEAFVLECATLGLGTCWLGGSFNRNRVMERIRLGSHEKLACVIAIGIPDELFEERSRKPMERISGLSKEAFAALPDWQRCALNCARRAPSAVNRQPWSFLTEENSITVKNISDNFGYGRLDCGIAMLHIELGAAHCGMYGEWHNTDEGSTFTPSAQ